MLTEIFGIFECLLTQNPTNQSLQFSWLFRTICKTSRKSKNMGLQVIISSWRWFQNLLQVNCRKWLKNRNLWFLEFYLYLKYISNKDDICQGKTISGVLLEEENLAFQIKEIHNGCPKIQNYIVAACIKGFLIC